MENTDGQPEPIPNNLIINLKNWVNERPLHLLTQRNVRRNIANAVTTDILNPNGSFNISQKLINYRLNVQNGLNTAIDKLSKLEVGEDGIIQENRDMFDTITKDKFTTRIRKEENGYISEEIRPDGSLISQAKIRNNDKLELTLNFIESRYTEKDANPKIIDDPKYPTGTKVLFLNHCASLGVITWKGK